MFFVLLGSEMRTSLTGDEPDFGIRVDGVDEVYGLTDFGEVGGGEETGWRGPAAGMRDAKGGHDRLTDGRDCGMGRGRGRVQR